MRKYPAALDNYNQNKRSHGNRFSVAIFNLKKPVNYRQHFFCKSCYGRVQNTKNIEKLQQSFNVTSIVKVIENIFHKTFIIIFFCFIDNRQ